MAEPKPIASLSSMLLARKGAARPAMRRQPVGGLGPQAQHDDLGWNDMGYDVDPAQSNADAERIDLRPHLSVAPEHPALDDMPVAKPEVVRQQESLASMIAPDAMPSVPAPTEPAMGYQTSTPHAAAPVVATPRRPRADAASSGKAAFTLRLDSERHLRLRLASAVGNRSAQNILIDLLDAYLSALPEIEAMASRLPAVRKR